MKQSGWTQKLGEILAKAADVLGSQELAEEWLERPAIGLNQRRPIELLKKPGGGKLVEALLERMKHGVYT